MSNLSTLAGLHTSVEDFDVHAKELCIGGQSVSDIADEIGRTPFYAYDKSLIRKRISHEQDNDRL